jgi:uncharacterized protein YceH (UPF0502 family)
MELTFNERRLLGVLIEKGFTTPEQYPLSINGVLAGANQKSCREPVTALGEDVVLDTLDSLRAKGLVTLVRAGGSRVDRFRHQAGDVLEVSAKELAVLAELLLRGPQTDGELRQRASRMLALEGLDEVRQIVEGLEGRPEPLVIRLSPPHRRRGVKYAHALYEEREEAAVVEAARKAEDSSESPRQSAGADDSPPGAAAAPEPALRATLEALRQDLEALKRRVEAIEDVLRRGQE